MSLLDVEDINIGNHIQDIIFEYIKDFGIFGIAPPSWINREFVPGNIKHWTEKDWNDVLKESDQYYVFVELHKHVHTINIYKRSELSVDEGNSYHQIYLKLILLLVFIFDSKQRTAQYQTVTPNPFCW